MVMYATPHLLVLAGYHYYRGRASETWVWPRDAWWFFTWDKLESESMKFLKRLKAKAEGLVGPAPPPDEGFQARWPALWEYLTVAEWKKGEPRQTSTVTLFSDAGCWKLSLNDRDQEMGLFATGPTLEGTLDVLEELLQAPAAPWRPNRRLDGKGKGKAK